ncbi:MAG: pyridoxal 5'-phosphate synthase glutaminase subunit PdxT [Lachnospiraceae bacterium]
MRIAILAVQGDGKEHKKMLEKLGVECVELGNAKDLEQEFDGLVLPGGESVIQGKLIQELGMLEKLKERIKEGIPVLATCAGLILLAKEIEGTTQKYLGLLPVTVRRNAYGAQMGSVFQKAEVKGIGKVPMTFIRAPYISAVHNRAKIMAEVDGRIVAVQYQNMLGVSFHPELGEDVRIHTYFLEMVYERKGLAA